MLTVKVSFVRLIEMRYHSHWDKKDFTGINMMEAEILHEIIECLVGALEAKDLYTKGHSSNVSDICQSICKFINLNEREGENIHFAAHLHDIGKIGIPDEILNKNGKLSDAEIKQIRKHPEIGFDILKKSKYLAEIAEIVYSHHERWDGKGYPRGLSKNEIPLGARIICIADSIDAMLSDRPYRQKLSMNECKKELINNAGTQFDPELIEILLANWTTFKK